MNTSSVCVTLVGGPTVLIEYGSLRLLTDPTFDPPQLYQETPVRFEKLSGPALSIDAIGSLDAILLSHDQHIDNLDNSGRELLPLAGATFTTKVGAARLGGNAVGLAPFETAVLTGRDGERLMVTATPARHGPIGVEPISGDVVGFVLGREKEGDLLYVTGDTVWYAGTAEVAQRFSPRIVLLFTGAAEPRGRFHMTMGSEGALEAAQAFPDATMLAAHNEGWVHLRESQAQLAATFEQFGVADRLTPLERGVRITLPLA